MSDWWFKHPNGTPAPSLALRFGLHEVRGDLICAGNILQHCLINGVSGANNGQFATRFQDGKVDILEVMNACLSEANQE